MTAQPLHDAVDAVDQVIESLNRQFQVRAGRFTVAPLVDHDATRSKNFQDLRAHSAHVNWRARIRPVSK